MLAMKNLIDVVVIGLKSHLKKIDLMRRQPQTHWWKMSNVITFL